jgi:manganese/zinc/iron transport system ATP- binding protein
VGLLKPLRGSITFNGLSLSEVRKRIAYVPQRLSIDWDFPASVFDVVLMGRYPHLGWFKRPTNYDYDCVFAALHQVGMYEYKDRHIGALSGGQQQRVFLARALVQEPDLYLMDEPFVGIDVPTEKTIISLLKMLRDEGKTIVVVHHDIQTLSEYFDTALLLNVSVIGYGPIETMLRPEFMCAAYGNKYDSLYSSPRV